jgi:hypothetical protein
VSGDPKVLLAEANEALDLTGNVMTHGATIAPDFVMRTLIAMRDIVNRHEPRLCRHCPESRQHYECDACGSGRNWPCPDVEAIFKVLTVGKDEGDE